MDSYHFQQFVDTFKADAVLRDKILASVSAEDIAAIANEAGFDITVGNLTQAALERNPIISDSDLESMAGSQHPPCCNYWSQYNYSCV